MERPMTGMTCTRCRTEDPSRSSPVPPLSSVRSCLSSTVDLLDVRRLGQARSGYLLRGRCGLNLINSMRHLDKCAPRTRIQRIIFILIHLPFSLSLSGLSPFSLPIPHFVLWLLSVRHLPSRTLAPDARTVSSVIRSPIHTRQARARCEEAREGGRPGEKRTHLSAPISPGSFVFLMSRRIWFVNCETLRVIDSPWFMRGNGGKNVGNECGPEMIFSIQDATLLELIWRNVRFDMNICRNIW